MHIAIATAGLSKKHREPRNLRPASVEFRRRLHVDGIDDDVFSGAIATFREKLRQRRSPVQDLSEMVVSQVTGGISRCGMSGASTDNLGMIAASLLRKAAHRTLPRGAVPCLEILERLDVDMQAIGIGPVSGVSSIALKIGIAG